MANEVLSTTTAIDQDKYIASRLLSRSLQKLVAASICDKETQPQGSGVQATFIRYKRMDVPLAPLTEGNDPANSSFSLEQVVVTLDQWGDVITLTDVAQLTTKHPLLKQAMELLSDNAQRVIDREIQLVWLAGTNVLYGDGSVVNRAGITNTAGMQMSDTLITKARIILSDGGASPRGGPSGGQQVGAGNASMRGGKSYLAVTDAQVMGDIMKQASSYGSWAAVATYQSANSVYNSEVGTWLGMRWVETNFLPRFSLLGNTTAAVASGASFGTNTPTVTSTGTGSLAAVTHYFKVTRKSKQSGFEEAISIEHTITPTAGQALAFAFTGAAAGYAYNVYIGTATGDANLRLAASNVEVGQTATIAAVPAGGAAPPASPPNNVVVHVVYVHGEESTKWVGLQSLETFLTPAGASHSNPLALRRKLGYKFMAKALVPDQWRLLRMEVPSAY